MKKYPKVPRYDLPFVPDQLFSQSDLCLLEKVDGMNIRFTLYEDRYKSEYSQDVLEHNPNDGDIVFGTKNPVRGRINKDKNSFQGELSLAIEKLREINIETIRDIQDEYGPLIWFAEYMVPHTLDYDYDSNPPPALIGFDIYSQRLDDRDQDDIPANPYKESFVGFLDVNVAEKLFTDINIEFAPKIQFNRNNNDQFDPEEFEVPRSKYSDVKAEGVVIRSDKLETRSKYVRESFREMHKSSMGGHAEKSEDPTQWILDTIITPARIRKHIRKEIKSSNGDIKTDDDFVNRISRKVLVDGWTEEFTEIQSIDGRINPSDLYKPTKEKVKAVSERMNKMSKRTNQNVKDALKEYDSQNTKSEYNIQYNSLEVNKQIIDNIHHRIDVESKSRERIMLGEIIGWSQMTKLVIEVCNEESRDIGPWAVMPGTERILDNFWRPKNTKTVIWKLDIGFIPSNIREEAIEIVKEIIESQTNEPQF